ncbi:MAG: ferredoxin [Gordonia sp. (in: high G+C Gram-positive bacteria)]
MKIHIDLDKCAGHARCFAVSPELFDIDDDGYALRSDFEVDAPDVETAREAAVACPERAITTTEP